ncbi:MAG: AI-2E family transporter [Gemmatimonadota bacterium]
MEQRRPTMIIAWALLLAFFVWSIRPVLSPIILFLVLVYLLTPLFGTEAYRRLVIALGTLTALWLVHVAGSFLAPFVLGLILAYVADPLVDRWERQNISRTWGAVAVVGLAGLVLALSLVLVIPMVFEQGRQFLEDLPEMLAGLQRWYEAQIQALVDSPLPLIRDIQFERALEIESRDVMAFVSEQIRALQPSWGAAIGLGRGVQTAFTILGYIVLTPVLTFYLLRDFHSIERWVGRLVPRTRTTSCWVSTYAVSCWSRCLSVWRPASGFGSSVFRMRFYSALSPGCSTSYRTWGSW